MATHTCARMHAHTHGLCIKLHSLLFQCISSENLLTFAQRRSTVCCFVVASVWMSLCGPMCMSLFGHALKDWFSVCCFEPTAKCWCLTNPPCSGNQSSSRSPTYKPSLSLSLSVFLSPWLGASWLLFLSYSHLFQSGFSISLTLPSWFQVVDECSKNISLSFA